MDGGGTVVSCNQSSTGRPGPEVSKASEAQIGRPAAASTWTPQNQEGGIVNAGLGQGPDPGASSSTAASSPQVGEAPSFGLGRILAHPCRTI